jgi:hypothetical protein
VFPENIRDQAAASATRQYDLKQAKFCDLQDYPLRFPARANGIKQASFAIFGEEFR